MFYVSQADVDRARDTADAPRAPYLPGAWQAGDTYGSNGMIGMPEWGISHPVAPQRDDSRWGALYRFISNSANVGGVMTAKLMGLVPAWNNPVTFKYFEDRYVPNEAYRASNTIDRFQTFDSNMWAAYAPLSLYTPGQTEQPS